MSLIKCDECGNEISSLAEKCPNCGAINVTVSKKLNEDISKEYEPISMWGYVGYELLFAIPLIGLIVLCVYAFGGTQNINLKNFARSYFCTFLVMIVLFISLAMLAL